MVNDDAEDLRDALLPGDPPQTVAFNDGPVGIDQDWPAQIVSSDTSLELRVLFCVSAPHPPRSRAQALKGARLEAEPRGEIVAPRLSQGRARHRSQTGPH